MLDAPRAAPDQSRADGDSCELIETTGGRAALGLMRGWRALAFSWVLASCAGSPPTRSQPATTSRCVKHAPSRLGFAERYSRRPDLYRSLSLLDDSRPGEPLEAPGRYTIALESECYAAAAHFELGHRDWPVTIEGDDLSLIVHETNVVGLVVPARSSPLRIRITRDGSVVFDRTIAGTDCPEEPGLCIRFDPEDERPPPEAGCRATARVNLGFMFERRPSPWRRGQSYQLELELDGARSRCSFEVPLRTPLQPECGLYTTTVADEPAGVTISGSPARVVLRILTQDAALYEGRAAPEYVEPHDGCEYDGLIRLWPADFDR